jgi:hypothetical protein
MGFSDLSEFVHIKYELLSNILLLQYFLLSFVDKVELRDVIIDVMGGF